MNSCVFPSNGSHAFSDIASSHQLSGLQSQQRQTIDQISGNLVAGLSDANSSGGVFSESTHVGLSAADIHDLDSDDDDDGEAPKPKYGKKTRGRVKVKMEFIKNKLRRYTTFSKRKTGIMKKVLVYHVCASVITSTSDVIHQTKTQYPT